MFSQVLVFIKMFTVAHTVSASSSIHEFCVWAKWCYNNMCRKIYASFLQVSEMLLLGSSNFNYYWGPSRATDFIWNCFSTLEFFFWSFCVLQLNRSGKQTMIPQNLFILKRLINIYKFYGRNIEICGSFSLSLFSSFFYSLSQI